VRHSKANNAAVFADHRLIADTSKWLLQPVVSLLVLLVLVLLLLVVVHP
jgi:hypothetical protein